MVGKLAIKVRSLRVSIGGKEILKNVDLKVPAGKVTAVMGPSGSGKSTLLKTINRLIELVPGAEVSGEVLFFGRDVREFNPYELRREVGMIFQVPNPFPHLTIFENVALGLKLNGLARDRRELRKRVEWALRKAELWDEVNDRLDDYPSKLSGGQQQRLCLARALALKPKVLLLDEPTANIDPVNAVKIENSLTSLTEELGMTVVIVTHMPKQALRVSDYIAFLYGGKLIEFGRTEEVAISPKHELTKMFLKGEL